MRISLFDVLCMIDANWPASTRTFPSKYFHANISMRTLSPLIISASYDLILSNGGRGRRRRRKGTKLHALPSFFTLSSYFQPRSLMNRIIFTFVLFHFFFFFQSKVHQAISPRLIRKIARADPSRSVSFNLSDFIPSPAG